MLNKYILSNKLVSMLYHVNIWIYFNNLYGFCNQIPPIANTKRIMGNVVAKLGVKLSS